MKISSKIMKEAHRIAREIKNQYPEVNYSLQLGICIRYILQEGENSMVEVKTISETYGIDDFTTEKVEGKEYSVPSKVISFIGQPMEHTFELTYSSWTKYGKSRLYYSVDGNRRSDGYIDLSNKSVEGKGKVAAALYFAIQQGSIQL